MAFLHEDRPRPPDELAADRPLSCAQCGEEMWTVSVSTIVTDKGVDGTYTYECKHCGATAKVRRHSDQ
jgi:transcription elongation factor Elf1